MMPTGRYLRSARIVTQKHCSLHARDRPRPRQRLLARVRPDRVRYASGATVQQCNSISESLMATMFTTIMVPSAGHRSPINGTEHS